MNAARGCSSPLSLETLVAYWAGDLEAKESDEIEAHVFACAACTTASERIAAITEKLRTLEPPIITAARLAELRAAGRRIDDNFVSPGQRSKVVFGPQDFIIHHLGGLELDGVDRVGVVVRDADGDRLLHENPHAAFDAAAGEVLVACQRHFAAFPPNIAFEITTYAGSETKKVTHYVVDHEWAAR